MKMNDKKQNEIPVRRAQVKRMRELFKIYLTLVSQTLLVAPVKSRLSFIAIIFIVVADRFAQ
jgi:hypothetical protein